MSNVVVEVRHLSKVYRLGEMEKLYANSFRERLMDIAKKPLGRLFSRSGQAARRNEILLALDDVSFQLEQGDVLGVIGRNGAGKSTLLKVLSRITAPTSGEVTIKGRLSSLLEVGTGFHPELTGRENIYLNGAILGMRRAETKKKFDEIVAFAETEKFLDTPVKRYSSGMYLRLAFAIAAHLDPEILLIDEVLSVGDVAFQRRCLDKMGEVASQGRTVIFVSHNTAAVQRLCPNCLWLDAGRVKTIADTATVYEMYLASIDKTETETFTLFPEDPRKGAQLLRLATMDERGAFSRQFQCDQKIVIEMDYVVRRRIPRLYGYFQISREDGTPVLVSVSDDVAPNPLDGLATGTHKIRLAIPPRTLGHGRYHISFSTASPMVSGGTVDAPGPAGLFSLDDYTTPRGNRRGGFFSTILDWQVAPCRE